ncbi:MAG: hypothetical protein WBY94_01470, partial [Polyangiaceae bacterium]
MLTTSGLVTAACDNSANSPQATAPTSSYGSYPPGYPPPIQGAAQPPQVYPANAPPGYGSPPQYAPAAPYPQAPPPSPYAPAPVATYAPAPPATYAPAPYAPAPT